MTRKLGTGIVLFIGALAANCAVAQTWPSRPIHIIVGYPGGTAPDSVARIEGAEVGRRLGQSTVVENRSGAAARIADSAVARAAPDGYSVTINSASLNSDPLFSKTDSLVVGKDLVTLGAVTRTPMVLLVRRSLGVKNFQELVAYSKKNPGKLNFGSITVYFDLMMDIVKERSGLTYTPVQYRASPTAEMLRGDTDIYVGTVNDIGPQLRDGSIMPILFMDKSRDYPNVPTAVQLGLLDTPFSSQLGYYGPAGLARDVVQKFTQAVSEASKVPQVVEGLGKLGLESIYMAPADQLKDYQARMKVYAEAARLVNFQPE